MIYIFINIGPIAAATLLGLAIGAAWLRATGAAMPPRALLAGATLGEFWLASILAGALILAPPQASPWVMAVGSAVVIWAGFVGPALWITLTALGHSARRTGAAVLHWLVVMAGQAALMQSIGLVPPPLA